LAEGFEFYGSRNLPFPIVIDGGKKTVRKT